MLSRLRSECVETEDEVLRGTEQMIMGDEAVGEVIGERRADAEWGVVEGMGSYCDTSLYCDIVRLPPPPSLVLMNRDDLNPNPRHDLNCNPYPNPDPHPNPNAVGGRGGGGDG